MPPCLVSRVDCHCTAAEEHRCHQLLCRLFGADASQDTAAAAAPLPPDEAAGLAAAVSALQLHTAELEARGVLQVAGAPAEHWLLPDGSSRAADDVEFTALPAYLQAAPMSGDRQPFFQAQQRQQAQQGPDERYQHWPSPAAQEAAAAAAESHDAIQEADEGEMPLLLPCISAKHVDAFGCLVLAR